MEDYQVDIKEINENLRIRIMASENLNDPNQNDFFKDCRFILTSNSDFYPEKTIRISDFPLVGNIEKDIEIIEEETGKKAFPLYIYRFDHSVRLYLEPISVLYPGCDGFVLAEHEEMAKDFIKAWNHYLNDPEYGFSIEERQELFDKNGVKVTERWITKEALWGYTSPSEAMEEAMNYV